MEDVFIRVLSLPLVQDRNLLLDNPAGKLKKAHAANNPARQLLSGTKLKALGLQHPALEQCKCGVAFTSHCFACYHAPW